MDDETEKNASPSATRKIPWSYVREAAAIVSFPAFAFIWAFSDIGSLHLVFPLILFFVLYVAGNLLSATLYKRRRWWELPIFCGLFAIMFLSASDASFVGRWASFKLNEPKLTECSKRFLTEDADGMWNSEDRPPPECRSKILGAGRYTFMDGGEYCEFVTSSHFLLRYKGYIHFNKDSAQAREHAGKTWDGLIPMNETWVSFSGDGVAPRGADHAVVHHENYLGTIPVETN